MKSIWAFTVLGFACDRPGAPIANALITKYINKKFILDMNN